MRIRTLLAICAFALPIPAAIAGCGGDESSDEDPQTVLDETFNNDQRISSGNLSLSANVTAEGEQGGSFEFSLSGPFQGDAEDPNAIPVLDWTASASGEGAGQTIDFEGGVVISEDNAFVEYQGEAYEVGTEQFSQLKEQLEAQAGEAAETTDPAASFQAGCEQALEQAGATDTAACEIDLESWLTNLTNEGTEDVGGSDSVHISGDANIEQILADIGELASAVPGAAAQGFDPAQLQLAEGAIEEASIDVYSTVEDNLLSKLEATLALDPAAIAGSAAPVDSVDVGFSFEIAEINEEQTVEAPADAQPIDQLLGQFGDSLGGLGGLGGGLGGVPGGGAGGGNTDAYFECIAQAGNNADAINACASEL